MCNVICLSTRQESAYVSLLLVVGNKGIQSLCTILPYSLLSPSKCLRCTHDAYRRNLNPEPFTVNASLRLPTYDGGRQLSPSTLTAQVDSPFARHSKRDFSPIWAALSLRPSLKRVGRRNSCVAACLRRDLSKGLQAEGCAHRIIEAGDACNEIILLLNKMRLKE